MMKAETIVYADHSGSWGAQSCELLHKHCRITALWAYVEDLATRIARLEAATALGAHLLQLECLSGTRVGRAAPPEHRLVLADRAQVLGLLLAAAHRAIPECAADGNLLADYSPITLVGLINGLASCVMDGCFACDALLSLILPMLLLEEDRRRRRCRSAADQTSPSLTFKTPLPP